MLLRLQSEFLICLESLNEVWNSVFHKVKFKWLPTVNQDPQIGYFSEGSLDPNEPFAISCHSDAQGMVG